MTDLKELPKGNTTIQWQLETLQVAATNLSTVATVFAIWGTLFAVVSFIFGVIYKTSAGNNEFINLFYFIVLNFVKPFCFQISQFIIIYNATRPTSHNAQFVREIREYQVQEIREYQVRKIREYQIREYQT
ncbi:hypothetical protein C2G38_2227862 [Gigaspora rosea]|uniref:Uncharacterized protein n=1 Tax=Gigaspora rosea TaxID=44941 RepID=A0A397U0W6_9GLOM|nr:hypothetical protein C2G38_2227862 [Gigaspora rosea]